MEPKRSQGRPARGENDVGRDKLVEAAREILAERGMPVLSRRAVAARAGVTPSLVSYYFPVKDSLVPAVLTPVIALRLARLRPIFISGSSVQDRLREIVAALVEIETAAPNLSAHAVVFASGDTADAATRATLDAVIDGWRIFYREGVAAGTWRPADPDLVLDMLWGTVRAVVRRSGATRASGSPYGQADAILDLSMKGIEA